MKDAELKNCFDNTAQAEGFKKAFGGWFMESTECILVLNLQKSNFGNYYELNIKIFVQGEFGHSYTVSKALVKSDIGTVFRRQPTAYNSIFDLDQPLNDLTRKQRLSDLFADFIIPFTNKALTRNGLKELVRAGEITLLPAVKQDLGL